MTVQNYMATQTLPALAAFVALHQANVGAGLAGFSTPAITLPIGGLTISVEISGAIRKPPCRGR